ncbi:hypothetical protein HNP00_003239 [Arthrobacter sp. AZCC_0090]|nr:hypothetical protein [Arthrobacter sp. AZCC_0090]
MSMFRKARRKAVMMLLTFWSCDSSISASRRSLHLIERLGDLGVNYFAPHVDVLSHRYLILQP